MFPSFIFFLSLKDFIKRNFDVFAPQQEIRNKTQVFKQKVILFRYSLRRFPTLLYIIWFMVYNWSKKKLRESLFFFFFFFGINKISRPLQVSNYFLGHVQSSVPHTLYYYRKEFLEDSLKMLARSFKSKIS